MIAFNVEALMEAEEASMGRPIHYRNAWQTEHRGRDGLLRQVLFVVYDCDPLTLGDVVVHESRYAVIDGTGLGRSGGVIEANEEAVTV